MDKESSKAPSCYSGLNDSSSEDQALLPSHSSSKSELNSINSSRSIKEKSIKIKNKSIIRNQSAHFEEKPNQELNIMVKLKDINLHLDAEPQKEKLQIIDYYPDEKPKVNQTPKKSYSNINGSTISIPKDIPSFIDFFDFNKDNISLTMCEKLNCFRSVDLKIALKNFVLTSRKTVNQAAKFRVLNLDLLQKLKDIEEMHVIISNAEHFQNERYSLLSIYHLFHLMRYFPKSLNLLNKNSIIGNVLKCTKNSVDFMSIYNKKVKLSIDLLLIRNFQAFVVYFMKLSTGQFKSLDIGDIEEQYIELVFNEALN